MPNRSSIAMVVAAVAIFFLTACGGTVFSQYQNDMDQKDFVAKQQKRYMDNQPPHYYEYSAPRDVLNQLYDATVPSLKPVWVAFTMVGVGYTHSCSGVGLPIPYGVELTTPEYQSSDVTMPMAEPTGLYTNGITTDATWVFCDFGHGLEPVYDENNVEVYFHPIHVDPKTHEFIDDGGDPSVTIQVKQ